MAGAGARYSVKAVGKRGVGAPRCAVCGCSREMSLGSGVCAMGCHWLLFGWVGFNAVSGKTVFKDARALPLAKLHDYDPATRRRKAKSWTKVVLAARRLGWSGTTAAPSQPTFIDTEAF